MKKTLQLLIYFAATVIPAVSSAQEILVKDINTHPQQFREGNDYSELFCNCGDYLFFAAPTEKGRELWRTDGTSDGTILLRDIFKGYASSYGGTMHCDGSGTLYFVANDGLTGWELWTSDGTSNGTAIVKDVSPGFNMSWSGMTSLGFIGDECYFITDHDYDGPPELWKSRGTPSSTVQVSEVNLTAMPLIYSKVASSTHLFFNLSNPATNQNEVWVTDGHSTYKLLGNNFFIAYSQVFGDKILFTDGNELWSSDGTVDGTVMIIDFGSLHLQSFQKFNDKLIFGVSGTTWISDGTMPGTMYLTTGYTDVSATVDDVFYGFGFDFSTGYNRIIKTDGVAVEVFELGGNIGDISMYSQMPVLNDKLIIQYFDETVGKEIGTFETISQTSNLIKDINPGALSSTPRAWAKLNNRIFFLADDGSQGTEIWSTDGTSDGTHLLKSIITANGDAFANYYNALPDLAISDDKLQLVAKYETVKTGLFTSDGTEAGTHRKFQFDDRFATGFGRADGDLIYHSNLKFYKTNGGTDEVTLVRDLSDDIGGYGYSHRTYFSLQNKLIFLFSTYGGNISVGSEFWSTDGTEAGTHVLKDINPGQPSGVLDAGSVLGSKLIFSGTDPSHGSEVWITDGTTDGTVLLKDINPGSTGSSPAAFTTFGDKVIFSATDIDHGNEIWITDGTEQGTVLMVDLVAGPTGSEPKSFSAYSSYVYFSAYDVERGWALWKTDGTAAGTAFIKDVIPGNAKHAYPTNLKSIGNKLFFAADDGDHGLELWASDGTALGTRVVDIVPGPTGSNPSLFTDINGVAYFQADGAFWRTNGTPQGTLKVSNLEPLAILPFENYVYFTAPHPDYGIELFKVEFTKLDQQITAEPISNKTVGDAPFPITASASSGLPLNISNGEEIVVTNESAAIVKPGTVSITLAQPGDALYNATELILTLCILPAKPEISVENSTAGQAVLTSSANKGNSWYINDAVIEEADDKVLVTDESGNYKVNVVIDGCTSEFSDQELVTITGIEGHETAIVFYPNPGKDNLTIKTTGESTREVTFLDVQGKPLSKFAVNGNSLTEYSLSNLQPGIYLIKITSGNEVWYQKLVKE